MSGHSVTIEWRDGWQSYTFTCDAAPDSLCRVAWDCVCESWNDQGVEDGVPWHSHDDGEWRCLGSFVEGLCNLRDWFENTDECIEGTLTVPVTARFQGDFYLFRVGGAS